MRSKTPLVLIEQLVMILVFAMVAAICLQVFVFSERLSRKNEIISQAVLFAQNTAEELKDSRGTILQEWKTGDGCWYLEQNIEDRKNCRIEVWEQETDVEGLQQAEVKVIDREEILFELVVAWQEVDNDG